MVVTHHPFDVPSHIDAGERVGRAEMAMAVFAQCGVDLLLAGHLHIEDRRFAPVSRETFERKLKGWTPVARMSLGIT